MYVYAVESNLFSSSSVLDGYCMTCEFFKCFQILERLTYYRSRDVTSENFERRDSLFYALIILLEPVIELNEELPHSTLNFY